MYIYSMGLNKMNKNDRINQLIQKHKPMTKADVVKTFQDQAEMKRKMTTNAAELEANLKKFNNIEDPLVDPESGDVLVWVRRPTTAQLESLVPQELLEYRSNPDACPPEILKKYENFQFEMMADLITKPKKDAEYWKQNTNMVFQSLFQKHLTGVLEDLGINAENF
jgi:hypothetical protein